MEHRQTETALTSLLSKPRRGGGGYFLVKAKNFNVEGAETVVVDDSLYTKKAEYTSTLSDIRLKTSYQKYPRYNIPETNVSKQGWYRFASADGETKNCLASFLEYEIILGHQYAYLGNIVIHTKLIPMLLNKSMFVNTSINYHQDSCTIDKLRFVQDTDNNVHLDFHYRIDNANTINGAIISCTDRARMEMIPQTPVMVDETVDGETVVATLDCTIKNGWQLIGSVTGEATVTVPTGYTDIHVIQQKDNYAFDHFFTNDEITTTSKWFRGTMYDSNVISSIHVQKNSSGSIEVLNDTFKVSNTSQLESTTLTVYARRVN